MSARSGRPCPAQGCSNRRDVTHVMCVACWRQVPKTLRDEVWRTYHAGGAWSDEAVDAREAAIAYAERALAERPAVV